MNVSKIKENPNLNNLQRYIYLLVAIILFISASVVGFLYWEIIKIRDAEKVLNQFHGTSIFLSTRIKEEVYLLEEELNQFKQTGNGKNRPTAYIFKLEPHFYSINKSLQSLYKLQAVFKNPEYNSILKRLQIQFNKFQAILNNENLDQGIFYKSVKIKSSLFSIPLNQLLRLHLSHQKDLMVKFSAKKSGYTRNTIIFLGIILIFGGIIVAKIFGQITRIIGKEKQAEYLEKISKEREELISELEQRNIEMEEYAYTVSHDLKSPLITIGSFVGLLEKDALDGNFELIRRDITCINKVLHKMEHQLQELLNLTRIGRVSNPVEKISMDDLVDEVIELVSGKIKARGAKVIISPGLPVIYGDQPRLLDVMQNLIDNAVSYMGNQENPLVKIGSRQESGEVVLYVRDNGMGIDPQYHQKVFGLFNTIDSKGQGTGIGLTIVKRIIEFHGGRIWVESEGEDRGCTFCFTVPPKERSSSHEKEFTDSWRTADNFAG